MHNRLNFPVSLLILLLCSCGGGGTPVDNPDPGPGPGNAEPQLSDPSEVQSPQALLPALSLTWPTQGGGPGNSGRTQLALPTAQPTIASLTSVSDLTSSAAQLAPDGSILVGSGALLMKFSKQGEPLWQRSLQRQLNATPFVDANGQIVISTGSPIWQDAQSRSNWIEALDPAGQNRWRHETADYPALIYAMTAEGSLLVRSGFGELRMLDSAGNILWQSELAADAIYNAVIADNGNIYTGTDQTALLCLDSSGAVQWEHTPAGQNASALTTNRRLLHPDGPVILLTGSEGQPESFRVSLLNHSGSLLDSWPCGEQFSFTGLDDNGNLLLHDRESRISTFSTTGELLATQVPGYGFPFGINARTPQRYFSVVAQPDDYSEYLLTSTDASGTELWRFSSSWSFRYPVLGAEGQLYCGDEQSFFALDSQGRKHWQQIHGDRLAGLSVAGSERIYSAGGRNVYAFDHAGQLQWQISADGIVSAAPALLPGGQIAFGDSAGLFYIYENNGRRISKYILEGSVVSSPAVGADGTLFVGTTEGELYSFSAQLEPLRQFSADSGIRVSPAIDGDGTAFVATQDGHIHAVYSDGIEAWEHNLGEALASQLVVGDEYRIFGATASGRVFALHSFDGRLVWDHYLGASVAGGLALDSTGRLLVATDDPAGKREEPQLERNGTGRGLYCFSADGAVDWSLNGPYSFSGQPLVDGSGRICCEAGGWLICADSEGQEQWRLQAGFEDDITNAVPLAEGRFAVASGTQLLIME